MNTVRRFTSARHSAAQRFSLKLLAFAFFALFSIAGFATGFYSTHSSHCQDLVSWLQYDQQGLSTLHEYDLQPEAGVEFHPSLYNGIDL